MTTEQVRGKFRHSSNISCIVCCSTLFNFQPASRTALCFLSRGRWTDRRALRRGLGSNPQARGQQSDAGRGIHDDVRDSVINGITDRTTHGVVYAVTDVSPSGASDDALEWTKGVVGGGILALVARVLRGRRCRGRCRGDGWDGEGGGTYQRG